jgi:hypothetical protein
MRTINGENNMIIIMEKIISISLFMLFILTRSIKSCDFNYYQLEGLILASENMEIAME